MVIVKRMKYIMIWLCYVVISYAYSIGAILMKPWSSLVRDKRRPRDRLGGATGSVGDRNFTRW